MTSIQTGLTEVRRAAGTLDMIKHLCRTGLSTDGLIHHDQKCVWTRAFVSVMLYIHEIDGVSAFEIPTVLFGIGTL